MSSFAGVTGGISIIKEGVGECAVGEGTNDALDERLRTTVVPVACSGTVFSTSS